MSNYLAVATVTAALTGVLRDQIQVGASWGAADVKSVRPDSLESDSAPLVNLFLYQVTPNAARRNDDVQTRNAAGDVMRRPTAALDLHYLCSFYGNDAQLEPQRLLGIVARTLHAQPLLSRQSIATAISGNGFLAGSNLDTAVDTVRFSPETLSLEELSKLWSVMFQTHYVLSAAYLASVVMIESDDIPRTGPPVRQRNLYTVPIRQPVVERVTPRAVVPQLVPDLGADQPIVLDSTLLITGQRLRGSEGTVVRIFGAEVTVAAANVTDAQITLDLTTLPPGTIHSGAQGLSVIQPVKVGSPPSVHPGVWFESNAAPFILHPPVPTMGPAAVVNGINTISADVSPVVVGTNQRAVLTLYTTVSGVVSGPSYTLLAWPLSAEGSVLTFPITHVPSGTYVMALQIDGAAQMGMHTGTLCTPLHAGPAGYDGPTVAI